MGDNMVAHFDSPHRHRERWGVNALALTNLASDSIFRHIKRRGKHAGRHKSEVRIKRSEQDIETLRKTQNRLLDRYDGIYKTLVETRDIADENRERLERMEERVNRIEELALENRAILFAIADHLDLTYEKPSQGPQSRLSRPLQIQRQQPAEYLFLSSQNRSVPAVGGADGLIQRPMQFV